MIKAFIYRHIGNLLYRLNGGLEGLHKGNRLYTLMICFLSKAHHEEDKRIFKIIGRPK